MDRVALEPPFLLYGASGYTGELLAAEARRTGMNAILSGRRESAVEPIARRLGLPHRTFSLESPDEIVRGLAGVRAVLLAAGPFSATSAPVVEACLRTGTHYLDITGEIPVFEACFARDAEAKARGCTLLPGAGFDVVPTDCLALALKEALPGAETLELAFAGGGRLSRGTARTMLENAHRGGAIREAGRICRVPIAWRTREVPFRDRARLAVTIPWGDIATAYRTTRIPNIRVYLAAPPRLLRSMRRTRLLAPFLRLGFVRRLLERRIDRTATGPDETMRHTLRMQLWGRAANGRRDAVEATLETPEGYQLTVLAALECLRRVLAGRAPAGAVTPALAFGSGFITEIPGCDTRLDSPAPARPA